MHREQIVNSALQAEQTIKTMQKRYVCKDIEKTKIHYSSRKKNTLVVNCPRYLGKETELTASS